MRNRLIKLAALLFLLMMNGMAWRWFERSNLYYPSRDISALPRTYGLESEEVFLTTQDGKRIHAWFIPSRTKDPMTLLLCHGNAGNISDRVHKAALLHKVGAAVLLFDYRGYGKSEGTPSEEGTYRDAEASFQYLTGLRGIPLQRIVFYGESLGTAVAVEMAKRHAAGGLILESAFTSTVDMAKIYFPWLPARWIVTYRYDSLSKMPGITVPLLVLHSPSDEIVPYRMGQALYAAAPGDKRFVDLTGSHNDGYLESGDRYPEAVRQFLNHLGTTKLETGSRP